MTTTGQQASKHPRWEAWKRSFKESNYITDFWTWLLTLLSKSAELVLFGSILYSSYQLVPGVPPVPPAIDAFLFLVQQAALDIGGMGLLKLAKRAGLAKESFPMRVGVTLVVLMVLNVVLASVKHALPMVPDGVFVVIETILLIARAVMAVLFGHAIHALREEYGESTLTIKDANELQQRMEALSTELAQSFNRQVQQVEMQLQLRMTETVQYMESDFQRRFNEAVLPLQHDVQSSAETLSIVPELKERLTHIERTAQVQLGLVTEEVSCVKVTLEQQALPQHIPFHKRLEQPSLYALPSATQTAGEKPVVHNKEGRQGSLEARSDEKFALRAFVYRCLEENAEATIETIQQRARSVGQTISTGSISRYRKQYFEAHLGVSTSRLKVVETEGMETRDETETELETVVEVESESVAVGE
jgi:hypothetical protein